MTKRESLILSAMVWDWLVDYPNRPKVDCPIVDTTQWKVNCALCEYSSGKGKQMCDSCPMRGRWPGSAGVDEKDCCSSGSVYDMYCNCFITSYDRAFFALLMVEAFEEVLYELLEEEFNDCG